MTNLLQKFHRTLLPGLSSRSIGGCAVNRPKIDLSPNSHQIEHEMATEFIPGNHRIQRPLVQWSTCGGEEFARKPFELPIIIRTETNSSSSSGQTGTRPQSVATTLRLAAELIFQERLENCDHPTTSCGRPTFIRESSNGPVAVACDCDPLGAGQRLQHQFHHLRK